MSLAKKESCRIPYSGAQDGIHILSRATAAGDELGWNYVNLVLNCQASLSSYRLGILKKYEACGSKVPFMSRTTLTDWIFSWLVNFKIDFRQQCSICGENPKVLAGDGTMLGILYRHANFEPIERPTSSEHVTSSHRRTERQFFNYPKHCKAEVKKEKRMARDDLQYFILKNTNKLNSIKKPTEKKMRTTERTEEERKKNILLHVSKACENIMKSFINCSPSYDTIRCLAEIFKVFVTDKPVSSLINYRFVGQLSDISEKNINGEYCSYETLTCDLFDAARKNNEMTDVITFVKYLLKKLYDVHADDPSTIPITYVDNYNPEKSGRAYYFTKHGGQCRQMPKYSERDKCDDNNVNADCKKHSYAQSSKSGTTYTYFIFDPLHYGHCYGFHLINNEGPKDAFAPVFLYMEEAPAEYFCDNSCILEEYALNREPSFWLCCRFWHDIFHGYHHKCPYTYNSRRIPKLSRVNTEICEQFNSFIKKIEFSGRAMSQCRFIFYLQFFIHQWNEMKRKNYEKQLNMVKKFCEV